MINNSIKVFWKYNISIAIVLFWSLPYVRLGAFKV